MNPLKKINIIDLTSNTLVSILLTIIFSRISSMANIPKQLSFLMSEKSYLVYDHSIAPRNLIITDKSKKVVNGNVYNIDIKMWNSGTDNLESSLIREPINITVTDCKEIIDFQVIKQRKEGAANISLRKKYLKGKGKGNILEILWDHLDPKYGAEILLQYVGTDASQILIGGEIAGLNDIKRTYIKESDIEPNAIAIVFILFSFFAMGVLFLYFAKGYLDDFRNKKHFFFIGKIIWICNAFSDDFLCVS